MADGLVRLGRTPADRQSKGHGRKDLPLEPRVQFSHLHANAFKFCACSARRQIRVARETRSLRYSHRLGNLAKKSQIATGESKSSPSSGMACPPFCTP